MNPGSSRKNRRAAQRYTLNRKMAYRLHGEEKHSRWKQGLVIDMSSCGLRIEASGALPVGTDLDLIMDWPGIYHDREGVRLFVEATVCRTGSEGIGLQITAHGFRFPQLEIPARFRRNERKLAVA